MPQLKFIMSTFAVALMATISSANDEAFATKLDELMPQLGAEKIKDRHRAQQSLQNACLALGAPGKNEDRGAACKLIAAKLRGDLPTPTRVWLIKLLEQIGREESVEPVAGLLSHKEQHVRDAALRAIANNPASAANDGILSALKNAKSTEHQVGLINALGFRGDPASVETLATKLSDKNESVASAAAGALGKVGTSDAATTLMSAMKNAPAGVKAEIGDASLACAEKLAKQGRTKEAHAIYKQLSQSTDNRPLRLAALQGLLKSSATKHKSQKD